MDYSSVFCVQLRLCSLLLLMCGHSIYHPPEKEYAKECPKMDLPWQKGPYIWAWGHFALAKRPLYMGMGTLCTGKKAPIYGHGDTLHWQKGSSVWAWGLFAATLLENTDQVRNTSLAKGGSRHYKA